MLIKREWQGNVDKKRQGENEKLMLRKREQGENDKDLSKNKS